MKNYIFGNKSTMAYEIEEDEKNKFKIRLWIKDKLVFPYLKKEKDKEYLSDMNKVLLEKIKEVPSVNFSDLDEIQLVKWFLAIDLKELGVSSFERWQMSEGRINYELSKGKTGSDFSIFAYPLNTDLIGILVLKYKRSLIKDEFDIINHDNYIFETYQIDRLIFINATKELINWLDR